MVSVALRMAANVVAEEEMKIPSSADFALHLLRQDVIVYEIHKRKIK